MRILIAVALAVSLGACAIQPESSPRDVPDEQQGIFGAESTGDEAAGENRVFLLAPPQTDGQQQLRAVLRDVPNEPSAVLESLLAGPNDSERNDLLDTALPDDLELLSVRSTGNVLTIDVNDALTGLTQDGLRLAVAQLVVTASELDGVNEVQIRVNGENQQWPVGDTELTDRPLTVFDYPGLVESTEPSFPPIPSDIDRS